MSLHESVLISCLRLVKSEMQIEIVALRHELDAALAVVSVCRRARDDHWGGFANESSDWHTEIEKALEGLRAYRERAR